MLSVSKPHEAVIKCEKQLLQTYCTCMSTTSQCLQKADVVFLGLGASGSTITRTYIFFCKQKKSHILWLLIQTTRFYWQTKITAISPEATPVTAVPDPFLSKCSHLLFVHHRAQGLTAISAANNALFKYLKTDASLYFLNFLYLKTLILFYS